MKFFIPLLLIVAAASAQTTVVLEYEAKDSTKFAALSVKPEIAPRLKLWFPPVTAVYQIKITHFDGTESSHLLDMKATVPVGAGPLMPQTWLEAGITLPLGGPPKDVTVNTMTVGSPVTAPLLK